MATNDSGRVLVDTSAWIDFFRKKEPCHGTVLSLLSEERICCAGIILAELIQGAKSEKELDVLRDFVSVFEFLPEGTNVWQAAGELSFSLRRKGKTVGLSDCLIAVMAMQSDVHLLSLDAHFEQIRQHAELKLHSP